MRVKHESAEAQRRFGLLGFYDKFEHIVILILTASIAVFIVFAIWNLALKIFLSIASNTFDPTDYAAFQAVFGMIFTVIIALEFKRSLLVAAERQHSVVQVRTVVLIAMLAILRKLLIPRHWTRNGGIVRPCCGNNHAWGRLLACARPGSIRVEGAACRWGEPRANSCTTTASLMRPTGG
jgi:uncharacterized membrane protein (DUF373 family)